MIPCAPGLAETGFPAAWEDAMTTQVDEAHFRDTLGRFASGITIVTATDGAGPVGFTCQSFSSVSLDPPLVSFSVMASSTSYPRIRETGGFAVNVLSEGQRHVSAQFARRGADKWAGIDWTPSSVGNPLLDDALMWVDCELWAEHEAGDHVIVIGRVTRLDRAEGLRPLLYYRGGYRSIDADADE
ncbi:flavin reductase family protein [Microbacterium thalassium]|uniref:Flavin reductase (DIM6/NTAB) family NADH-FMN oxidoreductase RutF n=1 Tax=Microbacterium thalassium TaxID=362649 RepID=A0A7X0KU07_9MICO|nr:flavin reductase family protein [Microbacterium thalassium]MBB6390662.1 flavin reductase (DIM6/NTAB) family NADH-FMN oxidoreductase RutF [Microbacterium thalassium]GLK25771.1 monooxygenase [Microbacterium thalassium]